MLIVADENIPFVWEAFAEFGEVLTVPGRAMTPETVREADVLLVRSVTPVGPALLEGSKVRFVGTATIGTDHVDQRWLAGRGIAFSAAPGSNANSVAEYVTAALLVLARRGGWCLAGKRIGIVGAGNVGSRVARKAEALGMQPVLNDPPLARSTKDPRYRPLAEALDCDIVTLHVPLTREGPDATFHMVNEEFLARMRPGAVLVNTSRGAVVDSDALRKALEGGRLRAVVLDVWENEPTIDTDLLRRVDLGTPHIAGYSLDGKVNATRMLYEAVCRWLDREPTWAPALPPPVVAEVAVTAVGEEGIAQAVLETYPIERDDAALRALIDMPPGERAAAFDRLRKEYPVRREFPAVTVAAPAELQPVLSGLGFRLAGAGQHL